jgi:hypothetical protein
MTRQESVPDPAGPGRDVLGGPDPAEWEDELRAPA